MEKACKSEKCNCNCDCCKNGCECSKQDCKCCKEGCKGDCDCVCKKGDCKCGCGCDCGCGCCKKNWMKHHHQMHDGGSGAVYCLGMIGAAIYFIGNASTFWIGVLGLLKAFIWPVFMVLEAFKALLG